MAKEKKYRSWVSLVIFCVLTFFIAAAGVTVKFEWDRRVFLWESAIWANASYAGNLQAFAHFRQGKIRKLELGKGTQVMEPTGRIDGVFEIYAWSYMPELGEPDRISAEAFVDAYNSEMRAMVDDPERYLEGIDPSLKDEILETIRDESTDHDHNDYE